MTILVILGISERIGDLVRQGLEVLIDPENAVTSVIIQLCATLILFLAVRFLFWNKITAVLEEKQANENKAFMELENARKEAEEIRKNNETSILSTKEEGYKIIERAKQKSYIEAEEIVKKAQIDANMKIEEAKQQIEKEVNNANQQIKKEIVEVAYLLAEKIINKEIDEAKYDELIAEFINNGDK